jgi:ligand-binding sensor domain-containing protein
LAGVNITAVATAPSGELWAATGEGALRFFNGDTWADAPTAQLPSPLVRTLLFTADGALWIGTDQGGLARYAP